MARIMLAVHLGQIAARATWGDPDGLEVSGWRHNGVARPIKAIYQAMFKEPLLSEL